MASLHTPVTRASAGTSSRITQLCSGLTSTTGHCSGLLGANQSNALAGAFRRRLPLIRRPPARPDNGAVSTMKIFIPSYNRPHTATAPALLDDCGVDYILVLRPSQLNMYRENPRFRNNSHCRIAVTDGELGIAAARESCRDFVSLGEWCLQLDDNIRGFTAAERSFYTST